MKDIIELLKRAKQIIEHSQAGKAFTVELEAPKVIKEIDNFLNKKTGLQNPASR
jgi:hypothetical protein